MKLFYEDKFLTKEELQQLEQKEHERLHIPKNEPLPHGFLMNYQNHLGKIYIDKKVQAALLGLNYACTLLKHIKMFKDGEYGEISNDDKYDNIEACFWGDFDGIFGCYKTYNWYLRIDMFELIINERLEVVTYVSLHKNKANQSELNCLLKEKVIKELNQKERNL